MSWSRRCLWSCRSGWCLHRMLRLAGRQVVIMLTPVRSIFHCEQQNGWEWLFAVLTGAGSLLVALAIKVVTRCVRLGTAQRWLPGSFPLLHTASGSPHAFANAYPKVVNCAAGTQDSGSRVTNVHCTLPLC